MSEFLRHLKVNSDFIAEQRAAIAQNLIDVQNAGLLAAWQKVHETTRQALQLMDMLELRTGHCGEYTLVGDVMIYVKEIREREDDKYYMEGSLGLPLPEVLIDGESGTYKSRYFGGFKTLKEWSFALTELHGEITESLQWDLEQHNYRMARNAQHELDKKAGKVEPKPDTELEARVRQIVQEELAKYHNEY